MARQYNFIYQKLVRKDTDIVGAIAYSLYKKEKAAFVENFKSANGKDPEEEDIAAFHNAFSTETNVERLRLQASVMLGYFTDNICNSTRLEIEKECVSKHKEMIAEAIKPAVPESRWKQYLHGSLQSLIGAVAFMILMAALVFALSLSESEYSFTIGGNGGAKMEKKTSKTPTLLEPTTINIIDTINPAR